MCPVSEAKFRKPVLAGLRSNNEMNLFGFRRCYRSPQRGSGSRSSISPDHSAFPAQCGLSRCRVRVSADVLRGGTVVAARCPRLHRPPPPSPPQPWYIQLGNCSHSLQSLNNVLESQIFSLTGRTFLFNLLFLVIQSIHFTTSPCVLLLEGGGGFVVVADASR